MRISDWSSDVCSSDLGRLWKYVFGYLDVRAESYAEKPRSRKRRRAGFWARARRRRFPVFPTMMRNLAIRAQEGEQMDSPDLPEPVYREVLGGLRRINAATLANRPTLDFLSRAADRQSTRLNSRH